MKKIKQEEFDALPMEEGKERGFRHKGFEYTEFDTDARVLEAIEAISGDDATQEGEKILEYLNSHFSTGKDKEGDVDPCAYWKEGLAFKFEDGRWVNMPFFYKKRVPAYFRSTPEETMRFAFLEAEIFRIEQNRMTSKEKWSALFFAIIFIALLFISAK